VALAAYAFHTQKITGSVQSRTQARRYAFMRPPLECGSESHPSHKNKNVARVGRPSVSVFWGRINGPLARQIQLDLAA
jgi:hypothetical protein